MIYVIDKSILFDSEEKTLSRIDSMGRRVSLTTTSCRLLEVMALNSNQVLFRTFLLENVWEKNGYVASEASLNNNISVLRKILSNLSHEQIEIKTIPKMGFKLEASVSQHAKDDNHEENNYESSINDENNSIENNSDVKNKKINTLTLALLTFFIITSGLFCSFYFLNKKDFITDFFVKKNIIEDGKLYKCSLFNVGRNENKIEAIEEKLPETKGICGKINANIYYDLTDNNRLRSELFFSAICYRMKGDVKCENIKRYVSY